MQSLSVQNLGKTNLRRVTAYIDHDLYGELEKLAESDSRSVSQMIAVLVKKAIAEARVEGKI